ncbi:hypothetical protein BHYA_0310g00040 [Botrytis hyacinthi]|uniref:Uncharacterized protein n=1 Tax=Botrytis hyacinthi TaxID=278943 RepID=A0A4Z1GF93_9HELO|nr:hypothetical protein BHYA_0310g00040 [Botrytis hyacinthi]
MAIDIVPEITSHYPRSNEHSVVNNDIDIVTESLAPTVLNPDIIDSFGKNDTSMQHKNLDLNHKVHSAREVTFGKILKALWSESSGSSAEDEAFSSRRNENGEMISAKLRRRRATGKPGVHAEEHIVIYKTKPALAPNESLAK